MQCSWCDKPIPFIKALTGQKHCCADHRNQEYAEHRRLALQRLLTEESAHGESGDQAATS